MSAVAVVAKLAIFQLPVAAAFGQADLAKANAVGHVFVGAGDPILLALAALEAFRQDAVVLGRGTGRSGGADEGTAQGRLVLTARQEGQGGEGPDYTKM